MLAEKSLCNSFCHQSSTRFDTLSLDQLYRALSLIHHRLCGVLGYQLSAMPMGAYEHVTREFFEKNILYLRNLQRT
jgi:hypothetical protein